MRISVILGGGRDCVAALATLPSAHKNACLLLEALGEQACRSHQRGEIPDGKVRTRSRLRTALAGDLDDAHGFRVNQQWRAHDLLNRQPFCSCFIEFDSLENSRMA